MQTTVQRTGAQSLFHLNVQSRESISHERAGPWVYFTWTCMPWVYFTWTCMPWVYFTWTCMPWFYFTWTSRTRPVSISLQRARPRVYFTATCTAQSRFYCNVQGPESISLQRAGPWVYFTATCRALSLFHCKFLLHFLTLLIFIQCAGSFLKRKIQ